MSAKPHTLSNEGALTLQKSISCARQNLVRLKIFHPKKSAKKMGILMYATKKSDVLHWPGKKTSKPFMRMKRDVQKKPQIARPGWRALW